MQVDCCNSSYDLNKQTRNMAHPALFPAVFLAVLSFFASCAAQQNCSKVQCELLPVGDFASEFQFKSSEKGVRMVYLNLTIANNDSYQTLELKGDFLSDRWVWASSIGELMLSLSYDYDVLSLGLLKNQVRKMSVRLKDEPNGCLAGLNSLCQNKVVGKVLLGNVTSSNGKQFRQDVVCVAEIDDHLNKLENFFEGDVEYRCCKVVKQGLTDSIQCEHRVERSNWFIAFYVALNILTLFVAIFGLACLLLALPDFIFNLRKEYEKEKEDRRKGTEKPWKRFLEIIGREKFLVAIGWEKRLVAIDNWLNGDYETIPESTTEDVQLSDFTSGRQQAKEPSNLRKEDQIPVDDGSPFTFSSLLYMCNSGTEVFQGLVKCSFNFKLIILWYCVMPIFVYIELALFHTLKDEFSEEIATKRKAHLVGRLFFLVDMSKLNNQIYFSTSYLISPAIVIMALKKEDFIEKMEPCPICHAKPPRFIGEEVWNHLKIIPEKISFVFPFIAKFPIFFWVGFQIFYSSWMSNYNLNRSYQWRCFILVFILDVVALIITVALTACIWVLFLVFVIVLLIACTPQFTLIIFVVQKGLSVPCFFFSFVILVVAGALTTLILKFSLTYPMFVVFCSIIYPLFLGFHACRFIVRMFCFTIIGLSFNAEIAAPLLTFILLVTSYMHECLCNLQSLYKDLKQMISQEWQESIKGLDEKVRPQSTNNTIPSEVFWYVCNECKVLPVWTEMFRMFCSIVVIFLSAFFALSAIFFGTNTYQIPTVASTVAVFVSGKLPMLFIREMHISNFSDPKKIDRKQKVKESVREFITKNYGSRRQRSATI